MFSCEFCSSTFSRESSLTYHQNHTRACLDIQGRQPPNKVTCRFCGESYAKPSALRAHEEKCDKRPTPNEEKMAEEIVRLQSELALTKDEVARLREENAKYQAVNEVYRQRVDRTDDMLQKQLAEVTQIAAKRSKVTHKTTTIYNQSNVSHNHLDLSNTDQIHEKLSEHLDPQVIAQGQVGIARLVVKNILTTDDGDLLYVCTDQDRHIFRYLNEEGKEVKDIRAGHLKDALDRSGIRQLVVEKGQQMWTKEDGSVEMDDMMMYHPRVVEIGTLNDEENDHRFRNELARLTTKTSC